ncbi:MAG: UpxY family transcription antiterminator [Bacteroidales bacterium]
MSDQSKIWYAVYCRSRFEKRTFKLLEESGIEAYLPLVKTLKQWSDRRKWVEVPLFRSYIFVRIIPKEYFKVLQMEGVVRFVTFEGKAVPIPPKQITAIRHFMNTEKDQMISPIELSIGDEVEIQRGPLMGLKGHLINLQGKKKVKIEIEAIGKSIYITVPTSYLKITRSNH